MSVYTYTPGGNKLGDRIMALKPFMLEKGGQKYWNELWLTINRVVGANVTLSGGRTTLGEIDLTVAGDIGTAVPKMFADPVAFGIPPSSLQVRQMPGYSFPTPQVFIFQGFIG